HHHSSYCHDQQPSRPTRFPYTTLFRSESQTAKTQGAQLPITKNQDDHPWPNNILNSSNLMTPPSAGSSNNSPTTRTSASWSTPRDRKSTRLNSSHVKISYAVFCLKKKT